MNNPHFLALLSAPLLIGGAGAAHGQEALNEQADPPALQAPSSKEGLSLEEAEAKLKAMNERLRSISVELAEVSQESQSVVNAALSAVDKAKAEQAEKAAQSAQPAPLGYSQTIITGVGDSSTGSTRHVIIEGLGNNESLKLKVNPSSAPSLSFPQGLQTQRHVTTFSNGKLTITQDGRHVPTPHVHQNSTVWGRQSAREAQARAERAKERRLESLRRQAKAGHKSRERVAFSGNAIIEEGEVVRELVLFSGNAEVKGDVEKDVILLAGNLFVREGANIGGDAVVLAGNLTVEEGAHIHGDTVVSAGQLNVEEGAYVAGEQVEMDLNRLKTFEDLQHKVHIEHAMEHDNEEVEESDDTSALVSTLSDVASRFLFLAAAGLLLMTVLPRRVKMVGTTLRGRLGASAFIGLLGAFSVIPLGAVLAVSLVGVPLVPVLMAGVAFAFVMGMVAVASELGRILPFGGKVPGWLIASGALFLAGLSVIPSAGPIIIALFAFPGFGAVLLSRFGDDSGEAAAS